MVLTGSDGGNATSFTAPTNTVVTGNLQCTGNGQFAGGTHLQFTGSSAQSFAAAAAQNIGQLTVNMTASTLTTSFTGATGVVRQVTGAVTITRGTLSIQTDWDFRAAVTIGAQGGTREATLTCNTVGVTLRLGSNGGQTITVNDLFQCSSAATVPLRVRAWVSIVLTIAAPGVAGRRRDPCQPAGPSGKESR